MNWYLNRNLKLSLDYEQTQFKDGSAKTGTVTDDTGKAVREVKAGRVEFKIDKAGNVHVPVGKVSFKPTQIEENARAVIEAVAKARPHTAKGEYLQSCTLSATMSPPVRIDIKEFASIH